MCRALLAAYTTLSHVKCHALLADHVRDMIRDGAIVNDEADMPTLHVPRYAALDAAAAFERYDATGVSPVRNGIRTRTS